jgi:hypothetical protein
MRVEHSSDPTIVLKLHVGCQHCGYDLFGLAGDPVRCPECGGANPYTAILRNWKRVREPRLACATGALIVGPLLWLGAAWIGGTRAAWDSAWGWAWFGGTLLAATVLGYAGPSFHVVTAVLLVASQYITFRYARPSGAHFAYVAEAGFLGLLLLALLTAYAGAAFRRLDEHGWRPER